MLFFLAIFQEGAWLQLRLYILSYSHMLHNFVVNIVFLIFYLVKPKGVSLGNVIGVQSKTVSSFIGAGITVRFLSRIFDCVQRNNHHKGAALSCRPAEN